MIKYVRNASFIQVVQDGKIENIRIYESGGGGAAIIDRRETLEAVFQCSASDAVEVVSALLRGDKKRVKKLAHDISPWHALEDYDTLSP